MQDVGYIPLFLALVVSVYSAFTYFYGGEKGNGVLLESARNSLIASCVLISLAAGALYYSLITNDFQNEYVASYTSRDLSLVYRLSAFWAGNDGSLLFWGWLLSILAVIMVLQKRDIGRELVPYSAGVVMCTLAFFLIISLFIANPFQRLSFVPPDGQGLNPLLENEGMFFHPPLLLAGYVGFTIPFAFAMSALLTRRLGDEWLVVIRRWTLIAWLLLAVGNLFGAWWAYVELGWGGYWAWDPVENASFLPWLVGTAFLHSIMMQRRRGILKIWNMVLIIITFNLAILGTFLVRSSVLASVHTFAESPALGVAFLAFIGISLFGSVALLYYRSDELHSEAEMESMVSRESTFLLNNLLLVGAAFSILLGTFFPIISEAVRGVKTSVGPPFFNQVNGPIFLAIILLSGICTLIGWKRASVKNLVRNFLWPTVAAVILAIILVVLGINNVAAIVGFVVCAFVLFTILSEGIRGTIARRRMRPQNYLSAFAGLILANRPRYGGYMVHIGVLLFAMGVIGSSVFNIEAEASIKPGESMSIGRYVLTYEKMDNFETQSKTTVSATLSVSNSGERLGRLVAEKYFHRNHQNPVTEVAIKSTLIEDLYVILVGWDQDGTTAFKVLINPLVSWLWIGGVVLVVGALVAFWPERRRRQERTARDGEDV
ncbi:MAG: heme lyase CcmF/NrfE family subunit [Dehalococcoidia bacterium]|nr:heme lyase CcmF/NrfE family subunit [Dehalococcoidia bacterium]